MHCETLSNEKSAVEKTADLSEAARRRLLSLRGEPLFLADWLRPVFIHYEVPAAALPPSFVAASLKPAFHLSRTSALGGADAISALG